MISISIVTYSFSMAVYFFQRNSFSFPFCNEVFYRVGSLWKRFFSPCENGDLLCKKITAQFFTANVNTWNLVYNPSSHSYPFNKTIVPQLWSWHNGHQCYVRHKSIQVGWHCVKTLASYSCSIVDRYLKRAFSIISPPQHHLYPHATFPCTDTCTSLPINPNPI